MVRNIVFFGFFVYVVALATPCCCGPLMSSEVENIVRPTRPKTFGSPDELRSYLDQLGQYLAVVSRPRFGKRSVPSTLSKPRFPQYVDQQRLIHNIFRGEDGEPYKYQYQPAVIRNSKDLYDLLFSSRRENGSINPHQYYVIQQDPSNADISLDSK